VRRGSSFGKGGSSRPINSRRARRHWSALAGGERKAGAGVHRFLCKKDVAMQDAKQSGGSPKADLEALDRLNADYIRSVQAMDVKRFEEILADDFLCSNPDGSLVDRAAFLRQTAQPVTISGLEARDVNIRLMGDFAIIHARTACTTADGRQALGRYTDVWARRGGRWLAVSAHVTRG
jgi:ketosteroid isomerase-like protein